MAWGDPPPADGPPPRGPPTLASFVTNTERAAFPSPSPVAVGSGARRRSTEEGGGGAPTDAARDDRGNRSGDLGFRVTGSKKGGFPVTVEKRSCGKKVTVVRNVVGDRSALLSLLKKKLGCGGAVNGEGTVEVQGERRAAVERCLAEEAGCLASVSRAERERASSAGPTKASSARKAAGPTRIDKKMAAARATKGVPAAAVDLSSITEQAAKRMKPAEMKAHLKAAGLSIQGNRKELLARLLEHVR